MVPDRPEFSVVVPTLDEEGWIERCLRAASAALGTDAEILVVDGGSRDRTRELAARHARVLDTGPVRGRQLNMGARASRGRVLLFLHADTLLQPGAGEAVRRALSEEGAVGGCFRFALTPSPGSFGRYRALEAAVRLRTRIFRTATGDQAIFATRDAFEAAGGFPDEPLFEDVTLVRRLKGLGRFVPLSAPVLTSRRRWEEAGFWKTVVRHWVLRAAHAAGVAPRRLARWYGDGIRRARSPAEGREA